MGTLTINLEEIINENMSVEEIKVLMMFSETNNFIGITIKDLIEDKNFIEIGISKPRLENILSKLHFINAIGRKQTNTRAYSYFIKPNGVKILHYLDNEY